MVNGFLTVQHHFDHGADNDSDPAGWNRASYSAHPIDSIEPFTDEPNSYRQAALYHLQIMLAVDEFITSAEDARLAVVAVAVVLGWPSARGLSVGNIADQLGCSLSTLTRSIARFKTMAGLDSAAAPSARCRVIERRQAGGGSVLIDGRNRQEACRRAEIEPTYAALNGGDPIAFIMSSNDRRRHMKLGQRAMIAAKVNSLKNNEFGEKQRLALLAKVSRPYVAMAALVLEYANDQADAVISGAIALNDAYKEAQARKRAVESCTANPKVALCIALSDFSPV